uniref:Uncharacterized protein n=1 Tax=Nelumbo nucifera TaxID=4432 RepID=A0A822YLT6_NELNU|nr:TPA_asm: hypothetical protein HUJ06_010816 [Nelumbo nucifera]
MQKSNLKGLNWILWFLPPWFPEMPEIFSHSSYFVMI